MGFDKPFRLATDSPRRDEQFSYVIGNERWSEYLENVQEGWEDHDNAKRERQETFRLHLGRFICREWNKRYGRTDDELVRFKMNMYTQQINWPPTKGDWKELMMWSHECFWGLWQRGRPTHLA